MKSLILLALLFCTDARTENVPLPPSVTGINEIMAEARNLLTTKISELGKNFIPQLSDKTVVFVNNANLRCNGRVTLQGEPVSSLKFNFKIIGSELIEKSIYTGCNNEVSLVEDVITRGSKLTPVKYADFIKGKREFDLNENETYRLYRLSNSENEEIFKMLIEKKENSKLVEFFFLGQKFARLNYDYKTDSTRLTYTYSGYKAKYVRNHANWEFDHDYDPFTNTVLVTKNSINQIAYINTIGLPLTQNEFLSRFDSYIISGPIKRIRNILEYHNYYFPETKVVQTGSGNERMKEELRITLVRLQNNTEINLVKKQIQDYIEAVENGFISDTRPKP